jgi:hypothetical protein
MEEIRETISEVLKAPRKDENAPVYGRLIKLIDYSLTSTRTGRTLRCTSNRCTRLFREAERKTPRAEQR